MSISLETSPCTDDALSGAVDLARSAAQDSTAPGHVGDHLGVFAEGDRVATHLFESSARGYRGWRWAVTVARAPRSKQVTVSEVVLLPGPDSVIGPAWVPWSDRLAPGDLGPNDQLAYRADDPLLEQGYEATDDEDADRVAMWELGLGRPRVLSPLGRAEAALRWYTSDSGPTSDEAIHAAAACASCGYFLPLAGTLRQMFGVCANEWSPADGRVVSVDHGCGAHSETDVEHPEPEVIPALILDETGYEAVVLPRAQATDDATDEAAEEDVVAEDGVVEVAADANVAEGVVAVDVAVEDVVVENVEAAGEAADTAAAEA